MTFCILYKFVETVKFLVIGKRPATMTKTSTKEGRQYYESDYF